jgi:hypothetical protein
MAASQGFWSYVHDDDRAEGGRISRLARDIVDQYQMLTGEEIRLLFLDKDDIEWGDQWRKEIDSSLASVAFFIPVITPRYFMSPECRRELQFFLRRASDLGIKELILPLHYINVPALDDETAEDELIILLGTFQWEDWRELRFSDIASGEYRRSVARLAEKLVQANKRAEESPTPIPSQLEIVSKENEDDTPGIVDTLADFEEMFTKLPGTLTAISQDIAQVGEVMQEASANIERGDKQGKGFAARLIVVRQTASRLSEPTEQIWSLSNIYTSQLHSVDSGIRIIIERAPVEIKESPDTKSNFCDFLNMVRAMSAASNQAIGSFRYMLTAAEPLEKMSRDLRPVLRRLRQGLTILIESTGVIQEWIHLIDSLDIVCEDSTIHTQENAS